MRALRWSSLALVSLFLAAGAPRKPTDVATAQRLGGASRFLTHVSTDKPIYKAGEAVYVRGVVLDAKTRAPAPNAQWSQVTILGPKGETVFSGQSQVQDGAFGLSWTVPEGQAGGEYTVSAAGAMGHAPGERKFDVRVYRPPRLKSQIVFARDGYGPGDTLSATLETTRAEGGVPKGARIQAVARVDGADVAKAPCSLDDAGRCTVSLKLPAAIERGEGVLAFTIEDGGVVETATKTIPLLVQSFDIALYPEGGDLVAGLTSRVYFEARTLSQKPADIAGVIVDSKGRQVTPFRTVHEGRGRFDFTPAKGETYTLRVTEPSNVKKTVALPAVQASGATLWSTSDVVSGGAASVKVAWTGDRVVKVTLRHREVELSQVTLDAGRQKGSVVSLDAKDAEGVLVATVTDKDGTPLAERLLFRAPRRHLTIALEPDRARYVPGAPVQLKLRTLVDGRPTSALVGLTVSDDSVQELIEKREQAPSLPVMALLEGEVKQLADAHVYLDPKHPKAEVAVDLLLGTQGWRRFALVNVGEFLTREQDAARRVLAFFDGRSLFPPADEGDFDLPMDALAEGGGGGPRGGMVPRAPMPAPPPGKPMAAAAQPVPAKQAALKPVIEKAPEPVQAGPLEQRPRAEPALEKRAKARDDRGGGLLAKEAWAGEDSRRVQFLTVRQYAHQVRPGRQPNDRLDFAETLFWAAAIRTDAKGEATVAFGTSDAVTSFRAAAGGVTADGVLGAAEVRLDSVKPFYVEPKLPLEVTEGDVVRLPIAFVNGTREPLAQVSLSLQTKADLRFSAPKAFGLKADERARRVVELAIGPRSRTTELTLDASAGGYQDVVTRALSIKPRGFPSQQTAGGLLEKGGRATFRFTLPADTVPGSVETSIQVYPSPAGNLSSALESMVREPSGCFEQTSSTTYPLTMALTYFTTHTGADPAVVKDAQSKLERGYQRLTGFECKEKGYEWFGEDPGHEALTAYGILQFTDMKAVRKVDGDMLARSRAWLLKQRDGKGGFERKRRALHTWLEDQDTSDAYITWALLEAGEKGLSAEVQHVLAAARASKNAYVVALGANVALQAGDTSTAKALMAKLAEAQGADGFVKGGTQSIVGSTGKALAIETTALAVLAWLDYPVTPTSPNVHVLNVEKAMKGLAEASTDGSYGSTQSTVLALKAVLEYDKARNAQRRPGAVQLLVDGKPFGKPVPYDGKTEGALVLPDVSELLPAGPHTLELQQQGGGQLPWSIAVKSHRVKPESSPEAKVALDVALPRAAMKEGDVVEVTARVTNRTDEKLPTVIAIVGVPGGLEPRIDHLKELVKAKRIDAYEVLGRDVVLYWRGMTPKQQVRVPVSLVAAVPGKYVGPASRAYLYYGNEHKVWVDGLGADVAPKN